MVPNVAPRLCADQQHACRDGDFRDATAMQAQLAPLISALEREIDPATIDLALFLPRPVVSSDLRLPLVESSSGMAAAVTKAPAAILDWMSGASGLKPESLSCAA